MKIQGQPFSNGKTCKGIVFAPVGAPIDFAEITINGRYPEKGWAVNRKAHELVRVYKGAGALEIYEGDTIDLLPGDVVGVPPGSLFAWNGTEMTIHMACSPPFTPDQYEIIEDDV